MHSQNFKTGHPVLLCSPNLNHSRRVCFLFSCCFHLTANYHELSSTLMRSQSFNPGWHVLLFPPNARSLSEFVSLELPLLCDRQLPRTLIDSQLLSNSLSSSINVRSHFFPISETPVLTVVLQRIPTIINIRFRLTCALVGSYPL